MQCFQISDGRVEIGLPVAFAGSDSCFVPVLALPPMEGAYPRMRLDGDLAARVRKQLEVLRFLPFGRGWPRLYNCDVEERGEVWLREETADTKGQALVVMQVRANGTRRHAVTVKFTALNPTTKVLTQHDKPAPLPPITGTYTVGHAVAMVLSPGDKVRIEIELVTRRRMFNPKFWSNGSDIHKRQTGIVTFENDEVTCEGLSG